MQPSELEIQREVETLRDIRRRSTAQGGPGSLILDPDLPSSSSQSAPNTPYWTSSTDDSSSSSHEDGSSENSSHHGEDDPSHLFWVPARLHPEIAPAEFRAFLKEHARAPADGAPSRSSSVSSRLGRKSSMLSRQYKPSENDGVEDEKVVPVRRKSVFANPGPQLTINDLQKLEELAEEASQSDDPTKLRSVLRRSLSLNVAPSAIDQMDMTDMGDDDADLPVIVPRPGQILRRAARTKIRKPGMTGDGPHRFTATRSRRVSATRSASLDPRSSSDLSSNEHGDSDQPRRNRDSDTSLRGPGRPDSYSEETSIYDAYAGEESDELDSMPTLTETPDVMTEIKAILSPPMQVLPLEPEPLPLEEVLEPEEFEPASALPVLHHPQPKRIPEPIAVVSAHEDISPPRAASSPPQSPPISHEPPLAFPPPPSPSPSEYQRREKEKEKDKRGLFGKWGSDKTSKKGGKGPGGGEREAQKDSGFLGSLFGSKKKQQDAPPLVGPGHGGRETAVALLGASKSSKNYTPSPSPQPVGGYARYPIHVERAIYRLSHIKLANPRRPLYEQVLISNLMFWYLGVINKTQNGGQAGAAAEKEQAEREKKEKEEREKAEKERERQEKERERAEQKKEGRRGSLTKNPGPGTPGARKAEMPVRGPQYDMQHRAMEQEYGVYGGQPGAPPMRTSSAPPVVVGNRTPPPPPSQTAHGHHSHSSVQLVQPQPHSAPGRFYNQMGGNLPLQHQLPPGAMPPANPEVGWMQGGPSSPIPRSHMSPSPPPQQRSPPPNGMDPRRTRSPPPGNRYTAAQEKQPFSGGGGRLSGRSLSATAVQASAVVPPMNGNGKMRKGQSAHAVAPHPRRMSEEEDVPLALWQQQQQRQQGRR